LNKEILFESSVPQQSINKISLSNQHLTSFVDGKVGIDDSTRDESLMILHITIPTTKNTYSCVIEQDASVDKLK
jgi:hypothetical protein